MARAGCCEKVGLKKGAWTAEEDRILVAHIQKFGHENWRALPKQAGLLRCGKSCRFRWINYLRPDIKRGNFSKKEEDIIINLHAMIGNKWSSIAARLPGRTDNEVKNVWHTYLKKRAKDSSQTIQEQKQMVHVAAKNMMESDQLMEIQEKSNLYNKRFEYPRQVHVSSSIIPSIQLIGINGTQIKEEHVSSSEGSPDIIDRRWLEVAPKNNPSTVVDYTDITSLDSISLSDPLSSVGSDNADDDNDMSFWLKVFMRTINSESDFSFRNQNEIHEV